MKDKQISSRFGTSWTVGDYSWCLSYLNNYIVFWNNVREGGAIAGAQLEDVANGNIPDSSFAAEHDDDFRSSMRIKIQSYAAKMIADGWPEPPEEFPTVDLVVYGFDNKHKLPPAPEGLFESHSSLAKKLMLVDELPDGILMQHMRRVIDGIVVGKNGVVLSRDHDDKEKREVWKQFHLNNLKRNETYMNIALSSGLPAIENAVLEPFADGERVVQVVDYGPWKPFLDRLEHAH